MRILWVLCTLILTADYSFAAELKNEIAKCSALIGNLERLECFDNVAKNAGLNKPKVIPTTVKNKGSWNIETEKNPIDDTKTVYAKLIAKKGESKWSKPITLMLRCQSKQVEGFVIWDEYLGDDEKDVLIRIGTNTAVTRPWDSSTDHLATFIPSPKRFILDMLDSNQLVLQVTPYDESPRTAIFDTTGIKNAIKPLAEACEWDLVSAY